MDTRVQAGDGGGEGSQTLRGQDVGGFARQDHGCREGVLDHGLLPAARGPRLHPHGAGCRPGLRTQASA